MTVQYFLALFDNFFATPDLLAKSSFAMAMIAAFFATLACMRTLRIVAPDVLSKAAATQLLRTEIETLKSDSDAREQRMVTGLANLLLERTREFGGKIDRFVTQIDGRAETYGEKATGELVRLGTEANQGRDAMRRLMDERLLDSTAKQTALARELREELGAGFQNLGRSTSSTIALSSEQQKERLDEVKKALEKTIELQGKAQEALRLTVESRLDAIRLENTTKLEEVRSTLDEKLEVALEARLHQSFSRIVDQLAKVYEEIGEMKSLATAANGHFPVPAALNAPKETFAP